MDAKSKEIVIQSLTAAQEAIRANMSAEGVNASGRTSRSLRVEERGDSIVLVIGGDRSKYGKTAPLDTLEIGSDKGERGKWFKSVIYNWTIEKGLSFESDSHRWAVSTIISRNIEESGTARHRSPIVVYSSVVNDTKEEIRSLLLTDFRQMISASIKTI